MPKREYVSPEFEEYGTVTDVTLVGMSRPGNDVLPGTSRGRDGGSVLPSGLG